MNDQVTNRRGFLRGAGQAAGALAAYGLRAATGAEAHAADNDGHRGNQRLSLERLQQFESLGYGMFISFDIEPFTGIRLLAANLTEEERRPPPSVYAPDKLDVGQWISVARDAGMKYAVLTTKRYPGFCLWPSKHTDYSVANSGNKIDVVEKFVEACAKRGVQPGFYYNSFDMHHCFGLTSKDAWRFTTSLYQTFQTNQITELLTSYGPIAEVWIDIPRVLGRGYRTFLYEHMARLQPNAAILMNCGVQDGKEIEKRVEQFWPSDLLSIERRLPPETGHRKWQIIEGKEYYLPGEFCDSIMPSWFWREGEQPRADQELLVQFQACRQRGVNLLLDAPPDIHGLIPQTTVDALMRLQRSAGI